MGSATESPPQLRWRKWPPADAWSSTETLVWPGPSARGAKAPAFLRSADSGNTIPAGSRHGRAATPELRQTKVRDDTRRSPGWRSMLSGRLASKWRLLRPRQLGKHGELTSTK